MRRIEILAPAGGTEQLKAAVRCGADAVYLGTKRFNARRNAQNFDVPALTDAVAYCHAHDVAVHVALNTLVTDRELGEAAQEIEQLARLGADAVIVQDMGVANLVRRICPSLPMHASTQMSVHNAQGVRLLSKMGFSRAVLARELTAQEIRSIADQVDLELEIFVHGALCMSVSGMCYLSSMLGERSGNRGMCAQPCRLNFSQGQRPYALSLKDMTLIPHAAKLAELGVCSLKIEGRMKRPEYVAAAVTALRQALSGEQPDMELLQSAFSRSGFTDGYFIGKRDRQMFGYRTHEDVQKAGEVQKRLAGLYQKESQRCPVSMSFSMQSGRPIALSVWDDRGNHVTRQGELPQPAQNRSTTREDVERSMRKTGGTPFFVTALTTEIAPGLMVPMRALNQLRTAALEALYDVRAKILPKPVFPAELKPDIKALPHPEQPKLRVRLQSFEQYHPSMRQAQALILPAEEILKSPKQALALHPRLMAELPALVFPDREPALIQSLQALQQMGIQEAVCQNIGEIGPVCEQGMRPIAGYLLNIINTQALLEYQALGIAEATLSMEIHHKQAQAMARPIPCGLVGYGHLALMTMRACPARQEGGCSGCDTSPELMDRKGKSFFLSCHEKQFVQLHNPLALYLADVWESFSGLDFLTLRFVRESREECAEVFSAYQQKRPASGEYTRGLYFRQLK